LAWNEIKDPAIRVPTNSFFIAISPIMRDGYRTPKMRRQRGARYHILARFGRVPIEKARNGLWSGLSEGFCDNGAMPVICPTCQILTRRKQVSENTTTQLRQVETAFGYHRNEKPAAGFPARAAIFAMMSKCP
jgi:hypothetical protein